MLCGTFTLVLSTQHSYNDVEFDGDTGVMISSEEVVSCSVNELFLPRKLNDDALEDTEDGDEEIKAFECGACI